MPENISFKDIAVSANKLKEWHRKRDELRKQMEKLQQDHMALNRMINAAMVLQDHVADSKNNLGEGSRLNKEPETPLPKAVKRVLGQAGRPLEPIQIRKALAKEGYSKQKLGNYFYTVLMRLKEKNDIEKQGLGYVLASQKNGASDD